MPRVVITDATFPSFNHERAVVSRYGADLEEAKCKNEADVMAAAACTNVLLVQFAQVGRHAINELAPAAAIVRYGIGLDNIDLVAAKERGIRVAYVPDYATGEVADHTVTLILTALRKIFPLDRSVREGKWDTVGVAKPIAGFSESTIGFIGFGRIGQEVHSRVQPFHFKTAVFDPFADAGSLERIGARSVSLDELFATADVITLHAPLTEATKYIVNSQRLRQMKSSAIIVNTARGALVDLLALEDALHSNTIAGAALDVFEQEPLPISSGLRRCPNLILTPHAAWYSTRAAEQLQVLAADEVDRFLSGRPARCPAPMST